MEMASKITAVREALHLNKKAFAKEIHISPSYVTEIESGKKMPSDSLLDLIMRKWNISVDWWETGEGPIFETKKTDHSLIVEAIIGKVTLLSEVDQAKAFAMLAEEFSGERKKEKP